MARVDTLTAYKCSFKYRQRNNPLIEEQRKEIKSGNSPVFTVDDLISVYVNSSTDILVGKNSDRAIELQKDRISQRTIDKTKSWYISPIAGKQGQPMTVVKRSNGRRYNFGSDAAALYNYHFFIYEGENGIIAIFHRQNGSGCKSVFLETANNVLKDKGLKLEMNLIIPLSDVTKDIIPTKITLQYIGENTSSDVADNLKKKKTVIRDIGLNLEAQDNAIFAGILRNLQLGQINRDVAFAQLKEEVNYADDFNDAEVRFKIGRRTRSVRWNEFESIIGVHDITEELHSAYKRTKDFVGELTKLSDRYYQDIIKSRVAVDE